MIKFEIYEDLTNINDSMELDSGLELARFEYDNWVVTLEVCGEVKVDYKGERYRRASDMPEELLTLFHKGIADECDDVDIDMNNWFEMFISEKHDGIEEFTGVSDVVDAYNFTGEEVKNLLILYLIDYLAKYLDEFVKQADIYRKEDKNNE